MTVLMADEQFTPSLDLDPIDPQGVLILSTDLPQERRAL